MARVVGMDNALMDILVRVDDSILEDIGLAKGVVHFPPDPVLDAVKQLKAETVAPGGCGANTMSLLSQLGMDTMFIGKVGNDFHAETFEDELTRDGVTSGLVHVEGQTGVAICLITPDGQRTFADNLGVGNTLTPDELPPFTGDVLYVSNFYLTDPASAPAVRAAIKSMKAQQGKVALDLSDPTVVEAHLEDLKRIVRDDIDIVFANEPEATAFTGHEAWQACHELAELCELAVVKLGKDGSLIRKDGDVIHVKAHVVDVVDTTGAGDSYAAGFLFGYLNGWPLEKAGELGSLIASKVIQQVGARLDSIPTDVRKLIR